MKTQLMAKRLAGFAGVVLLAVPALVWAPPGGLKLKLDICEDNLDWCIDELEACPVFPGDGQTGPELSYTDNGDGTFTDDNTGLMWEKKTGTVGDPVTCSLDEFPMPECALVADVNNRYTWSDVGSTDPGGTAFDIFLEFRNHRCGGEIFSWEACYEDSDCEGEAIDHCGLGGYMDWRLPTVKELQSLVDYSRPNLEEPNVPPVTPDLPGTTVRSHYWSSTFHAFEDDSAWAVYFDYGGAYYGQKILDLHVRAVRGGW